MVPTLPNCVYFPPPSTLEVHFTNPPPRHLNISLPCRLVVSIDAHLILDTTTITQPVASSPVSGTVEIMGAAGSPRQQRQRIGLPTIAFFYSMPLSDSALCIGCIDNTFQGMKNEPLTVKYGNRQNTTHTTSACSQRTCPTLS